MKLTGPRLVKKYPACNGTRICTTVFYKSPPHVHIQSQINPVNAPTPFYFLKIYFNIILPSTLRSSKWSLSCLPHSNPIYTSLLQHTCHMRRPSHSSPFHHSNNIYRGVRSMKLRILTLKGQCNWVLLIVSCLTSLFDSSFIKFVPFSMWSRVYRRFARICDSCNFKHRFTLPCGFDSPLC